MGIGVGIFLIALGAIITFALNLTIAGLDLKVVGWVLMIAGAGGLVLYFFFWNRRRAPRMVQQVPVQPMVSPPGQPMPPAPVQNSYGDTREQGL